MRLPEPGQQTRETGATSCSQQHERQPELFELVATPMSFSLIDRYIIPAIIRNKESLPVYDQCLQFVTKNKTKNKARKAKPWNHQEKKKKQERKRDNAGTHCLKTFPSH